MSENSYDSALLTSCVSEYNKISVWENFLQLWSNILMAFCWHVGRKENTVFLFSIKNTLIWDFRFSLLVSGSIWIITLLGNYILVIEFSYEWVNPCILALPFFFKMFAITILPLLWSHFLYSTVLGRVDLINKSPSCELDKRNCTHKWEWYLEGSEYNLSIIYFTLIFFCPAHCWFFVQLVSFYFYSLLLTICPSFYVFSLSHFSDF